MTMHRPIPHVTVAHGSTASRRQFLRWLAASGVGVAASGTLLAACGDGDEASAIPSEAGATAGGGAGAVEEVKIGVLLPVTGAPAALGESGYAAIELVFDEVNRNGGVNN